MVILVYLDKFKNKVLKNFWEIKSVLIITALSGVSLLSLLEGKNWQWLMIILIVCLIITLFFLFSTEKGMAYENKPIRRVLVMVLVFDVFAVWSVFFGISLFFSIIPFWFLSLLGSLLTSYISLLIWQQYFSLPVKKLLFSVSIIFLIVWEVSWVLNLLPLGYLALSMLLTWAWYISILLMRFHFTSKNIIWRQQINFLITNLVLYFIILFFFVRWL